MTEGVSRSLTAGCRFYRSENRASPLRAAPLVDLAVERASIDNELDQALAGPNHGLVRDAMRYAVLGGGQRIRPLLSLRVARLLGTPTRDAMVPAMSVEMFHCASLIVDDLPCMDDELTRRNRPCTHLIYGEATAILAAFSLVALAARSVVQLPRFQKKLLATLDCDSLIAGQSLNLTELKTVPLFEVAVQAGGSASPGFPEYEYALMRFAREFGVAFQLTDDLLDGDLASPLEALEQLESARTVAKALGERSHELLELVEYLDDRTRQANNSRR